MSDPMRRIENANSDNVIAASQSRMAVVIPCYKVSRHILAVLQRIGDECSRIYVVDDCCPKAQVASLRRNSTTHG